MANKQVFFKTYDTSGTIKGIFFGNQSAGSDTLAFGQFSNSLNGGIGDISVVVPRKFDGYNKDGAIEIGYKIEGWIADKEAPQGTRIFSAKIQKINTKVSNEETVSLNCSGYVHELALDKAEQSSNTIIFDYPSQDISETVKDIIDDYRTNNTNPAINYSASSISSTGKTALIKCNMNTPLELLNKCKDEADSDWFWFIDENNILYFKEVSTTPDHYFILGKDIIELNPEKTMMQLVNGYIITNGQNADDPNCIQKLYSDSTSITTYGRRFKKIRDDRYSANSNTADEVGARKVALTKDPTYQITYRIIDSNQAGGYDIESIKPGDTCKPLNLQGDSEWLDTRIITSTTYNIGSIDVVTEDIESYVSRILDDGSKVRDTIQYGENLKKTYTT